jgi:hypothetical protein
VALGECAIACAAGALSSRSFVVSLLSRNLKACIAFGTCALLLLLLSDTAILQYASVVESNFLLQPFVLVLAVTLWHLSTSPWKYSTKEASELMAELVYHSQFHQENSRTQIHLFFWLYCRQYLIQTSVAYFGN